MRTALALIAPVLLAACATTGDGPIVEGGPPWPEGSPVGIDRPVWVGSVIATPKQVEEDSRCPVNVQCVWAGRVVLTTRIDGLGWRETVKLTLGEPYTTHGSTLTLVEVQPGTVAGEEIDPSAYRFRFASGAD